MPLGLGKRAAKAKDEGESNSSKKKSKSESQTAIPASEVTAKPADVLLGRGKGFYEWRGNIRYQQIIALYLPSYLAAKKKEDKTRITNDVVTQIKKSGGRFLKERTRGGKLYEVSDKEARDKAAQALRHRRRLMEKERSGADMSAYGYYPPVPMMPPPFMQAMPFMQQQQHKEVSSTRTEDTAPVVSHRSDHTMDDYQQKPPMDTNHHYYYGHQAPIWAPPPPPPHLREHSYAPPPHHAPYGDSHEPLPYASPNPPAAAAAAMSFTEYRDPHQVHNSSPGYAAAAAPPPDHNYEEWRAAHPAPAAGGNLYYSDAAAAAAYDEGVAGLAPEPNREEAVEPPRSEKSDSDISSEFSLLGLGGTGKEAATG